MDNNNEQNGSHRWNHKHSRSGRVMGGIVIICVGAALLAKQMGVLIPEWIFTWEMLLIVVGFYIGAKHNFTRGGWFVPIIIGSLFLLDDVFPDMSIGPLFWPIFIIVIGLIMIFKPRSNKWKNNWKENCAPYSKDKSVNEDVIDSVSIFGGIKKNIISKDFKGGTITCIFGGAEINLSQADIIGRVELEMTQVFGGTKLIVPAHWNIQTEMMVAVLGGIEDKRPVQKDFVGDINKVLVIKGSSVFGGIEIKSY